VTETSWKTVRLGKYFRIKHGYAFKGEFFGERGPHILLTPGNFQEEGGLKLKGEKEKYYSGPVPGEFLLEGGDLVVAMTDLKQVAPILGSAAFIPESGLFLHNQRLVYRFINGSTTIDLLHDGLN
jgi:type I restriction enzyme S subunit